jgi:hypothetical protein
MFFAALILSLIIGRVLRGCLKWLLLAGLIALVANRDPVLWSKCAELFNEVLHSVREWILTL